MVAGYSFNLQEYCSYCENFSPELDQEDITSFRDTDKKMLNSISCKNINKCEQLIKRLRCEYELSR